jgi:hypothetical protein
MLIDCPAMLDHARIRQLIEPIEESMDLLRIKLLGERGVAAKIREQDSDLSPFSIKPRWRLASGISMRSSRRIGA